jgi:hypothetical protein
MEDVESATGGVLYIGHRMNEISKRPICSLSTMLGRMLVIVRVSAYPARAGVARRAAANHVTSSTARGTMATAVRQQVVV